MSGSSVSWHLPPSLLPLSFILAQKSPHSFLTFLMVTPIRSSSKGHQCLLWLFWPKTLAELFLRSKPQRPSWQQNIGVGEKIAWLHIEKGIHLYCRSFPHSTLCTFGLSLITFYCILLHMYLFPTKG